ncbi:lysozyme [Aeromonas phage vB_AsaP_MQM1]|nr:lysozyme [Aeromonas phage vB_AsaP_MQM1]
MAKLNKTAIACSLGAIMSAYVALVEPPMPGDMQLSQNGLAELVGLEGCQRGPYKCPAGKWTNGVGHTGPDVTGSTPVIRNAEVAANLRKDIRKFEYCVNRRIGADMTQSQFDSYVLFAFNLGCTEFRNSTLAKLGDAGRHLDSCQQFTKWANMRDPKTKKLLSCKDKKNGCYGLWTRRWRESAICQGKVW